MQKNTNRGFAFYLILFALFAMMMSSFQNLFGRTGPDYSQVRQYFLDEQVEYFVLKDGDLTLTLEEVDEKGQEKTIYYELADPKGFFENMQPLFDRQKAEGILSGYDYLPGYESSMWYQLMPTLLTVGLCLFLFLFILRQRAGGNGGGGPGANFGQAKARTFSGGEVKVTFNDVAGAEEEKAELQEIVDFLKDPQRFVQLGARIPKGVLLVGPPGTGKTLIAKAVAGEAGVRFLTISGSDFVELYVGVGASRVRDLFQQAKKESPAIVFIDEIDAVGRQRGTGLGGGHDEREQTLNQLLVEMDGFSANEGVIVIAATNRQDVLDPALLRPGRFDRQIYVGLPDIKGREEVLKVHARKKPLGDDVSLSDIARATTGFTGAELENLLNEAALLAARQDKKFITRAEIEEAMMKVIAGPEKRSKVVTEHTRRLTAYHEAGHAVVIHELPTQDDVHQITIIPRGGAGGLTVSLPKEDKAYHSKTELCERIAVCLGGRVAEQLVLGDISTGASNDIQKATDIARAMVTKYGMSTALGPINYGSDRDEVFIGRTMGQTKGYSEDVAASIDREVKAFVDQAYRRCEEILNARSRELELTAQYLLEHETMNTEDFENIFKQVEAEKALPPQE